MQFELYKENADRVKRVSDCSCLTPTQAVNAAISFGYRCSASLGHFGVLTDGQVYCTQPDKGHEFLSSDEAEEVLVWILEQVRRGTVGGFRGEMTNEGQEELLIPFFNSWLHEEDDADRAIRLEVERVERLVEEHEAKREEKRRGK
jgi:hypothetical protein